MIIADAIKRRWYRQHCEEGLSMRAIARRSRVNASTVMRAIHAIEDRDGGPPFYLGLRRLSERQRETAARSRTTPLFVSQELNELVLTLLSTRSVGRFERARKWKHGSAGRLLRKLLDAAEEKESPTCRHEPASSPSGCPQEIRPSARASSSLRQVR